MTITATLSGQTQREPFNAETYFANPDQYDVEYRNGEKPLRVIHVPETSCESMVLSVMKDYITAHHADGLFRGGQIVHPYDLFMTRRTDPAESLRDRYIVVGSVHSDLEDAERNAKKYSNHYHIIHLK